MLDVLELKSECLEAMSVFGD